MDMIRITGLWKQTDKNGNGYLTGHQEAGRRGRKDKYPILRIYYIIELM